MGSTYKENRHTGVEDVMNNKSFPFSRLMNHVGTTGFAEEQHTDPILTSFVIVLDSINRLLTKADLKQTLDDITKHVCQCCIFFFVLSRVYTTRPHVSFARSFDTCLIQAQASRQGVGVVFTKPPETVMFHVRVSGSGTEYLLFDSHPRPEKGLLGAHILSFRDEEHMMEVSCQHASEIKALLID
jgi:hypothetical protein